VEIARPGDKRGTAPRFSTDNHAGAHAEGAMSNILNPFPFQRRWLIEPRDFVPAGYCALMVAVDHVGRRMYGVGWTGAERWARTQQQRNSDKSAWVANLISTHHEVAKVKARQARRASGQLNPAEPAPPKPPPVLSEILALREKAASIQQAEDEALARRQCAFHWLRHSLHAQVIGSEILEDRSGNRYEVPFGLWGTSKAWEFLQSGRAQFSVPTSTGWTVDVQGWVLIPEQPLTALLAQQTSSPVAAADASIQAPAEGASATPVTRKGGRPRGVGSLAPADDPWIEEMHRLIVSGECTSPTAAARKVLPRDRCGDESTIRRLQRRYKGKYLDGAKPAA
jgi:hypothetical protein